MTAPETARSLVERLGSGHPAELIAGIEEMVAAARREQAAETLRRVVLALCPRCKDGHALDHGRVWFFCGAGALVREDHPTALTEAEILVAIRASVPK